MLGKTKGKWLAHYKCGCTNVQKLKKELTEYCPTHGHDVQEYIKLTTETEIGLS